MEKWKKVKGYETHYEVSNYGAVRSISRECILFIKRGRISGKSFSRSHAGRILKPGKHRNGYAIVILSKDGKSSMRTVHRLVATAFLPNPENKPQVNHRDGNKTNNNLSNLEWCTASENLLHAFRIGLANSDNCLKGEQVNTCKLTRHQVLRIRLAKEIDKTITYKKLSEIFGTTLATVADIVKRRSWKHL